MAVEKMAIPHDTNKFECPVCGSYDVEFEEEYAWDAGNTIDETYTCPDCGCVYTITMAPVAMTIDRRKKED